MIEVISRVTDSHFTKDKKYKGISIDENGVYVLCDVATKCLIGLDDKDFIVIING